jgi:hypothetical protein
MVVAAQSGVGEGQREASLFRELKAFAQALVVGKESEKTARDSPVGAVPGASPGEGAVQLDLGGIRPAIDQSAGE